MALRFHVFLADFVKQGMDIYVIVRKSKRRTQNLLKSLKKPTFEAKGRQYTTGKVIQSLFNVDLQGVRKVRSSNFMRYNF